MYIHIARKPTFSNEAFTVLLESSWKRAAVYYYQRLDASMVCYDDEQRRMLSDWRVALESSLPDEFKNGYHILEEGGADIGQDIIVAKGKITKTNLAFCKKSNGSLYKYSRHRWYCFGCKTNHGKGMVKK